MSRPTGAVLKISHLSSLVSIARESFPVVWGEKDFAYFLAHECGYARGIFSGNRLQAYVVGLLVQGELDIASIATEVSSRRQGLGRVLLQEAQACSDRIVLEVEASNVSAIALYRSVGFVQVGIRPKYYQGKTDALQMAWERQPSHGGVLPTTPRTQG